MIFNKRLTAEQRLTKAVVDITANVRYVALCGVLMMGNRTVSDTVPTACTNGRDEEYGRVFVDDLSDAGLRFVMLHECYHKLYRHLITWRWMWDENPQLANMACDYAINIKIVDDNKDGFAKIPEKNGQPMGCFDEQYRGMDAAAIYHKLKKEQKQQQQQQQNSDGSGKGTGKTGIKGDEQFGDGKGGGIDSHDWEGAKAMTEDEVKDLERELDSAIRQGALLAGKVGSGGDRDLADLLQTKVDWREVLREFIQTTCAGNDYSTWRRPSRRFISAGMYMPSGVSEQVGELVVAIDTSGSIGARELGQFLGEVKAIAETVNPEAVRLLYWDTKVCRDEKYLSYELDRIVTSTKPAGGGGTDVSCVSEYIQKHGIRPQAAIVLTDGYLGSDWGTWSVPVLWCIVGGNTVVAPEGKTIHVKD